MEAYRIYHQATSEDTARLIDQAPNERLAMIRVASHFLAASRFNSRVRIFALAFDGTPVAELG